MIRKVLRILIISAVSYVVIAFGLVVSQPATELEPRVSLDFDGVMARGGFEDPDGDGDLFQHATYETPDGVRHPVTQIKGETDKLPVLITLHGSGWHGQQFDRLGWALRDMAEVHAVTMRGHGETPLRRGDVDHVGQLEEDLLPIIEKARDAGRKVVLLGFSSGGGLVVRFAGGAFGDQLDGAVLLAPYLHHTAPTMIENSGGWARPLVRRLIGLSMLNTVGIRVLNHLTVVQFAMPQAILDGPQGQFATTAYSYRLNTSMAPRTNYLGDIAALPPFLLLAGRQDEAFFALEFEPTLSEMTSNGTYHLLDGIGHLDLVDAPETEALIRDFLAAFQ